MITGYNIPFLFSQFRNGNYYVPYSMIEKIRALSPQVLRFPGGTLANTYDSQLAGYGEPNSLAKENHISRMFDLLVRLETDTKVCYVANVYSALVQPDRVQYWIDNTISALHKLPQTTHVELGNEIAISGIYMGIPPKPGFFENKDKYRAKVASKAYNYLAVADKFYNAIKRDFPNMRISIPMQPNYTSSIYNLEWNRVLRTWGKNDCETQHIYLRTLAYLETKKEIEKVIANSEKPVIITEWAWNHGNDSTKNLSDTTQLYYKAFFKDFIDICRLDKRVEMTCRHLLYSDTVYSVIK